MKLSVYSLLVAVSLGVSLASSAHAQSSSVFNSTNATGSFIQSFEGYFVSFNTNAAQAAQFENVRGTIWTGAEYQSGVNIDSVLGIEYEPWTNKNLFIGSVTRNAGIAGVIVSQEIDFGIHIKKFDTEIGLGVGGGFDFAHHSGMGDIFADIKKSVTAHTFAGLRLTEMLNFHGSTPAVPIIGPVAGFTF